MFSTTLITILLIVAVAFGYYAALFAFKVHSARKLVEIATPFEQHDATAVKKMLVLGDSTAVGVGASDPAESVPGLVATHERMDHVENYALSGARIQDLKTQLRNASHESYDLILIQIGGNDIINFLSAKRAGEQLSKVLAALPEAQNVIIMSAGDVGATTIFPWFIRPFYSTLTQKYHSVFESVISTKGHTYVNLYEPPHSDPFLMEPKKYLSEDGLHPSSVGYAFWFEKILKAL